MAKIFITGVGGFIASHFADLFVKDHQVFGVDNFETGREDNINPHLKFFMPISVNDIEEEVIEKLSPDVFILTHASYKDPNNWMKDANVNVRGTAWLCYLAKRFEVKKIIYLNTSLCYGLNPVWTHNGMIQVSSPLNPTPDSYAITKTAGEQIIAMSGVPFVSLRLSNCYGPRNLNGAIPAIYKKIKAGESPIVVDTRRCFIYVSDLVDLIERIVNGEGSRNYYHVASGRDNSIWEVYTEIGACMSELTGVKYPTASLRQKAPHEAATLLLDPIETFEDFPGWSPKTPLSEGIMEAVKWYEKYGVDEVYTHLSKN